jgi:hypothetical protein
MRQLRRTPPAATAGLWHVAARGDSAVLKLVQLARSETRWPAEPDETDPYYWRREPLAYESGLLEQIAPLRAPACRGVFERPDGSVALWLEDVPAPSDWTPELLGSVAHRLGNMQAAHAVRPPNERWLSRDWLRRYLALHDAPDPEADAVLERLDALPQTLCHHDLHPANVLGAEGDVVIDWAYCGLAALGLDAGVLVADGLADGAFVSGLTDTVAEHVWAGYLAGLREGGWTGEDAGVRYAFLRGTALRLSWLPRGTSAAFDATIELLDRWRNESRELA